MMYLFIPLFIINVYFTLLPSLGLRQLFLRFITVLGLALLPLLFGSPLVYCFYPSIGMWSTVLLLMSNYLETKNIALKVRLLLIIPFVPLVFITGLFLFGSLFALDDFSYYAAYHLVPYFFIVIWALVKKTKWIQQHYLWSASFFLLAPPIILLGIWGYRHNPTTFLHTETVILNGKTQTYKNSDILTLLKQVEQLIVLDINSDYENVTSVTFDSVRENASFYQDDNKPRFTTRVLVNRKHELEYDLNLSYFENDYKPSFLGSIAYHPDTMNLQPRKIKLTSPETIADLENENYQAFLKIIQVDYYLKNDIYKDSK